jgi:O-antigen ligase
MQSAAMVIFLLIPLIPRPTFGGPWTLVAPAAVLMSVVLVALFSLSRSVRGPALTTHAAFGLVALGTMVYGARVIANGDSNETTYLMSRLLLILFAASVSYLLWGNAFEKSLKLLVWGILALALLVAVIGMTGVVVLESPAPPRTLGVTFPWYKTAGVPRSFGEQGIFVSLLLAYMLVYHRELPRSLRALTVVASLVLVAMGQSRNIYVGVVAVLLVWLLGLKMLNLARTRVVLVACAAAVLVVQVVLPVTDTVGVSQGFVGEGVYASNVEARFTLIDGAIRLINDDPTGAILGWSHQEWIAHSSLSQDSGVHNFFASSLLFLGLIGGSLTILGIFFFPLASILKSLSADDLTPEQQRRRQFVATAAAGVLVSLNFYEGFFSLALGVYMGMMWYLMLGRDRIHDDHATPEYFLQTGARASMVTR